MISLDVLLTMFIVRVLIVSIIIGILIKELFNDKRKNKSAVFLLLLIALSWIASIALNDYGLFTGKLPVFLNWITVFLLAFAVFAFIYLLVIRSFRFINKVLAFSTTILAIALLVVTLMNQYHFLSMIFFPIVITSLAITLLGLFSFIDFLIKTSDGYKVKPKKKIPSIVWKIVGVVGIVVVIFLLSFLSFTGRVTFVPTERVELSGELNIYNWEEYFDEDDAVLDDFEEEFGVKVNLYTFETEDELIDSVQNYEGVYDLVIPIDSHFKRFIEDGKLEKLDHDSIPNMDNIDPRFLEPAYNPGLEHGIPYLWGTTVLAINTKYVPEDTDSWEVLWNPKYAGKIGIMSNEVEMFGLGARYVGVPLIPSKTSDLRKINDFLKLQKELIGGYEDPYTIIDDMISEDLWVSIAWSVDVGRMTDANPNVKYVIPKEGTSKWIEHMVIPKGAANKENAEAFINFVLRPDISARISNYQWTPGVNVPAREFIDEEILSDETLNIPDEHWDRIEAYSDFYPSEEILEMRHKMWEGLME